MTQHLGHGGDRDRQFESVTPRRGTARAKSIHMQGRVCDGVTRDLNLQASCELSMIRPGETTDRLQGTRHMSGGEQAWPAEEQQE